MLHSSQTAFKTSFETGFQTTPKTLVNIYYFKNISKEYINLNNDNINNDNINNDNINIGKLNNAYYYAGNFFKNLDDLKKIYNLENSENLKNNLINIINIIEIDASDLGFYQGIHDLKAHDFNQQLHQISEHLQHVGFAGVLAWPSQLSKNYLETFEHPLNNINNFNKNNKNNVKDIHVAFSQSLKSLNLKINFNSDFNSDLNNFIDILIEAPLNNKQLSHVFAHIQSSLQSLNFKNFKDVQNSSEKINTKIRVHICANALNENIGLATGTMAERMGLTRDFAWQEAQSTYQILQAFEAHTKYTNKIDLPLLNLYIHDISCQKSLELIQQAKQNLPERIFAAVNIHHLFFNQIDITEFNTQFKFSPPLRSTTQQKFLQQALLNNVVDHITSGHEAIYWHSKQQTFRDAAAGAASIAYLLPACLHFAKEILKTDDAAMILTKLGSKPLQINLNILNNINNIEDLNLNLNLNINQPLILTAKNFKSKALLQKGLEDAKNNYQMHLNSWQKNWVSPLANANMPWLSEPNALIL